MIRFTPIIAAVLLLTGCDKSDKVIDQAGNAVGKQLSNFSRAVGEGVDQEMLVNVELSSAVTDAGLSSTTAKRLPLGDAKKGISVYFIAAKPISTTLLAKAFNKDGAEIGRSKLEVKLDKDDAKYHNFEFDEKMDSMTVKKYTVDIKPTS